MLDKAKKHTIRRAGLRVTERKRWAKCPACKGKSTLRALVPLLNSTIFRTIACELCDRGWVEHSWAQEIVEALKRGVQPELLIAVAKERKDGR